jgi:thioredoxin-related protein
LVAVLPQPTNEGRYYLEKLGVFVDEVKQLPLESIGVQGTPTLMLLDRSGTVTKSWIGRLPPEREQTVLSAL